MKKLTHSFSLALVAALSLTGCGPTVEEQRSDYEKNKSKVRFVADLGTIDGCNVKYAYMENLPNFYIVRCPGGKVATSAKIGKTNISGTIEID